MTTETKYTHRHLELAIRAHQGTSFSPEQRGEQACREFDATCEELREIGARPEAIQKLERLWVAMMNAKSRCVSTMIAGGSGFNVRRAEKANRSERNRLTEYLDHYNAVKARIAADKRREENPECLPIMTGDKDAPERLKVRIAELEKLRETMKAVNKLVRKGDRAGIAALVGEKAADELLKPDCMGCLGFAPYQLTNNSSEIRRLKKRLESIAKIAAQDSVEVQIADGVKMVADTEARRIYVEFPDKPTSQVRDILKRNGFKWTPSQGHWGRTITGNAIWAAKHEVVPLLRVALNP